MNRENDPNPFQGKNRVPAILITLFLSSFAVALFYIIYRQFSGGWERLGVVGPWRDTFAHTLDLDTKPILWDVYSIGTAKVEWEWGGFKPLSAAALYPLPTPPRMPQHWQGFSKEEGETVHVSAIVIFPSQRKKKPGYLQGAEVEEYVIGITEVRFRGLTSNM